MTAKEMFEELGYKYLYSKDFDKKVCYSFESEIFDRESQYIVFHKDLKYCSISSSHNYEKTDCEIGIKLHEAIHRQMKELKWISSTKDI